MTSEQRFWARVAKTHRCWIFGKPGADPYGEIRFHGQRIRPHRASWMIHYGPIPPGLCVCHLCDKQRRVRPDHLFLGTKGDNNRDCASKRRHVGNRLLTKQQVQEIRDLYATGSWKQADLARRFGVTQPAVSLIVNGERW